MSERSEVAPTEYVFEADVLKLVGVVVLGFFVVLVGVYILVDANNLVGLLYAAGGAFALVGGSVALLYKVVTDTVPAER